MSTSASLSAPSLGREAAAESRLGEEGRETASREREAAERSEGVRE